MKPRFVQRYGIGEWYGRSFATLTAQERIACTNIKSAASLPCPYRSTDAMSVACTKEGGVCSLRLYQQSVESGVVAALPIFCTVCPHRFKEDQMAFSWVGEILLGHSSPLSVTEVGFLVREPWDTALDADEAIADTSEVEDGLPLARENVGQIDCVLVHPDQTLFRWCALELQAVYFSGAAMSKEYPTIRQTPDGQIPFPQSNRRPDYRSSGPKRLMPQLQIKVPTLRRWGKKMAVVVDLHFFKSLGKMDHVDDVSNCDIVWFIVDYAERNGKIEIVKRATRYTTLERAVEGLTAGRPVSLAEFERHIADKLSR